MSLTFKKKKKIIKIIWAVASLFVILSMVAGSVLLAFSN